MSKVYTGGSTKLSLSRAMTSAAAEWRCLLTTGDAWGCQSSLSRDPSSGPKYRQVFVQRPHPPWLEPRPTRMPRLLRALPQRRKQQGRRACRIDRACPGIPEMPWKTAKLQLQVARGVANENVEEVFTAEGSSQIWDPGFPAAPQKPVRPWCWKLLRLASH